MTDKPKPDAEGNITIRHEHFVWLNREVLRLGDEVRAKSNEVKFLKLEVERLQNNADYLDSKLDEQLDGSLDYTKHIKAIYDEVQKAKDALDKCGTLETSGIEAWRILNNLLTPPPLP